MFQPDGGGVGEGGDAADGIVRRMTTGPDFRAAVAELVQRVRQHDLRGPAVDLLRGPPRRAVRGVVKLVREVAVERRG